MSASDRTLVVHTGGIGDLILACPALQALSDYGRLEIAGNPDRLVLVKAAGIANAVHTLDAIRFHTLFSDPDPTLLDFLQSFSKVFIFMRDDGTLLNRLSDCGIRDVTFHPGVPNPKCRTHASEYYAQCLGLRLPPDFLLRLPLQPGWDIVLHPGSGGREKNWPLQNYIEVGEHLMQQGRALTWLLGPADEHIALPRHFTPTRCGSLIELGSRLAASACYIGNDSGITHLAAAVGCPTIAVFGPTDPRVWSPVGPEVQVLTGNPWPRVEAVINALP